jgi:alpha-D-ribose 1-methylphosphonate 5-triphosphate diphosphatase
MVATNPARALGLIDRGELAPGKRADVVLVDDSLTVAMTLVAGRIAFASDLGKTVGGMQYSDE